MTFVVSHMQSTHNLLTFYVIIVLTIKNIVFLHVFIVVLVRHHNKKNNLFW